MALYTEEQRRWLISRWDYDLINRIVIALNEARPIDILVEKVKQKKSIPECAGELDMRGIDLSHQNLRGPWATIDGKRVRRGVSLRNVDLTFANLNWVILPHADLRGGVFVHADLRDAELIYSDLSGADLSGADMRGAWLIDTKFYDAKVTQQQLKSRRNLGQLDFDYHAFEL